MPKIKEVTPISLNGIQEADDMLNTAASQSSVPSYGGLSRNTAPAPKCIASIQPDGRITVTFLIDSTEAARIIRRAGNMDIGKYLWENILYRAVVDHVY